MLVSAVVASAAIAILMTTILMINDANAAVVCSGVTATITGAAGDDVIIGTDGNDVINGLGGNDVIFGGNGNDRICGSTGNDSIYGGEGNDILLGEGGTDILYGDAGSDILHGGPVSDTLYGGDGIDTLYGNTINSIGSTDDVYMDTLYGDDGIDALYGGAGNDILYGGDGFDTLNGGTGTNNIFDFQDQITTARTATLTIGAGLDANVGVECLVNEVLLGGGFAVSDNSPDIIVVRSHPSSLSNPTGWFARGHNNGVASHDLIVYAFCEQRSP